MENILLNLIRSFLQKQVKSKFETKVYMVNIFVINNIRPKLTKYFLLWEKFKAERGTRLRENFSPSRLSRGIRS